MQVPPIACLIQLAWSTRRRGGAAGLRILMSVGTLVVVVAGVLLALPGATTSNANGPHPDTVRPTPPSVGTPGSAPESRGRWYGLIDPTSSQQSALKGSRITRLTLPAYWDVLEPAQGSFDVSAGARLRAKIDELRAGGYDVILDPGLQYPPSWVFSLPGATRFVNQFGDVWRSAHAGSDVPNAVFNTAVRSAEASYLNKLAQVVGGPDNLAGIRVGGLLTGELRYPPSDFNGHKDSVWDYDSAAQGASPTPGWHPGSGKAKTARAALQYYFNSLTGYESWLMHTMNTALPGVQQLVLLPSWGLRPGSADAAIAGGFSGTTQSEVDGSISGGLDWTAQLDAIAQARTKGIAAVAYSTWVDAPSRGIGAQDEPPIAYLAGLASERGVPLAGENTGGGGAAALSLMLNRARTYRLVAVAYMGGGLIANGKARLSVSQFRALINSAVP